MQSYILILVFSKDFTPSLLNFIKEERIIFLNFLIFENDIKEFQEKIKILYKNYIIIDAQKNFRSNYEKARKRYISLYSSFAKLKIFDEISFVDLLRWDKNLSLWWISNSSIKDNEIDLLYGYLTQIEIIDSLFANYNFNKCIYFGDIEEQSTLFKSYFKSKKIEYYYNKTEEIRHKSVFYINLKILYLLLLTLAFWVKIKINNSKPKSLLNAIIFYSNFPYSLINYDTLKIGDKNYSLLPDNLIINKVNVEYLIWIELKISNYKSIKNLIRSNGLLCLNYLELKDFIKILKIFPKLKSLRKKLKSKEFELLLNFENISFKEIFYHKIYNDLHSTSLVSNLFLYYSISKFSKLNKIAAVINSWDFYPVGRAINSAVKSISTNTKLIGFQHASVTKNKLWFCYSKEEMKIMPISDYFICHGKSFKDVLIENGIEEKKIILSESPRYEPLFNFIKDYDSTKNPLPKIINLKFLKFNKILVASSLSTDDTKQLLQISISIAKKLGNIVLFFRPHPSFENFKNLLDKYSKEYNFYNWELASGSLYNWIKSIDLVLFSYSTVGDEALVLDIPAISFSGYNPPLGTYGLFENIKISNTESELKHQIEKVFSDNEFKSEILKSKNNILKSTFDNNTLYNSININEKIIELIQ